MHIITRAKMKFSHLIFFLSIVISCNSSTEKSNYSFKISFDKILSSEPVDGRLLLMISNNSDTEPRYQVNDGLETQMIFGVDVNSLKSGEEIEIDDLKGTITVSLLKSVVEEVESTASDLF